MAAKSKVAKVMHEFKAGTLNSGSAKGPKVKSKKQAIAIALSEQARAKKKAPAKKVSKKGK
jgi:hypothetical protein